MTKTKDKDAISVIDMRCAAIGRLYIALLRDLSINYLNSPFYGAKVGDALLCTAIYIGQIERKPMSANKLALFTGIPRSTVVRKLNEMQSTGHIERIGNCFHLTRGMVEAPDKGGTIQRKMINNILKTGSYLSHLETVEMERGDAPAPAASMVI